MKQTRQWICVALLAILCGTGVLTSCGKVDSMAVARTTKDYFPSWNQCEALTALKEYVEDVTNQKSAHYISAEDRIVTIDMDGTFVGELYPTYFEYNMLEYRARWKGTAQSFRHDSRPCGGESLRGHDHR